MLLRTKHSLFVLLAVAVALFFIFRNSPDTKVGAATPPAIQYLSGFAWSSNIGWISFNGTNSLLPPPSVDYGVVYNGDPTSTDGPNGPWALGDLSGYAWSSNIGWISFGCGQNDGATGRKQCSEDLGAPCYPDGAGGCDLAGFGARIDAPDAPTKLQGFARACAVFDSGCSGPLKGGALNSLELGNWDGWISLEGMAFDGTPYGVSYEDASKRFRDSVAGKSFAWGGGVDDDGQNNNVSPQVPGWIDFAPVVGGQEIGVKMCDQPDCGAPAVTDFDCVPSPYPRVNQETVWKVTPSDPSFSYQWVLGSTKILNTDYELVPADEPLNTPSLRIKYKTAGYWDPSDLDVVVKDAGGKYVGSNNGKCPAGEVSYTVADKGFYIVPQPNGMSTQFIRSIRSITIPDVVLEIQAYGGFNEPSVTIHFVKILSPDASEDKGHIDPTTAALVVEPQFWRADDPAAVVSVSGDITLDKIGELDGNGIYKQAKLRLKLTKNQALGSDQNLPSSPDALGRNYRVQIDNENGGGSLLEIPLKINNPTGGVKEK